MSNSNSIIIHDPFFGQFAMIPSRIDDYWFLHMDETDEHEPSFDLLRRCIIIDSHDVCAICHETYEDGELQLVLPCNHGFHERCGLKWLERQATCPLDRRFVQ